MKTIPKVTYFYLGLALFPLVIYVFPDWLGEFKPGPFRQAPWAAFILLGFLGWRLNQTRILFSAILLLAYFAALSSPPGTTDSGLSLADQIAIAAMILPVSLTLLMIMREAPLFNQRSLLRLLLAATPVFFLLGLALSDKLAFVTLLGWKAVEWEFPKIPQAALAGPVILAAFAYFGRDLKLKPFLHALAFAVIPVMLALDSASWRLDEKKADEHAIFITVAFLCSSAILLWAIFFMYWQRVYLDELTGISNRRALDEKLATLDKGYSLAMVDIDHFKKFNDTYGHEEGDNVLRLVGRHLSDASGGRAYRYGGEEFCLVFEDWSSEVAQVHADGIRASLASRDFIIRLPKKIRKKTGSEERGTMKGKSVNEKITISIGVARPDEKNPEAAQVIKLADQALYEAKEKGRNCVIRKN